MGNAERREPTIAQILKEKDLKPLIRQSREALLFCCYGFRSNVSVCSVWTSYVSSADVLVALDIEKQEINIYVGAYLLFLLTGYAVIFRDARQKRSTSCDL